MRRAVAFVLLVAAFARDLWASSLQVARAVIRPGDISPGFIAVPLHDATSDLEITVTANYITLTPGTLTVDVSADRRTLLIHSLLSDGDTTRADVAVIEARVLRVSR